MPKTKQRLRALFISAVLTLSGGVLAKYAVWPSDSVADGLQINVFNVKNTQGRVKVLVFDQATAFDQMDYSQAAAYRAVAASTQPMSINFPELREGYYAIVIMHDENNDDMLGMSGDVPTEGYAVSGSNDPNGYPVFEWSLVEAKKQNMVMRYW